MNFQGNQRKRLKKSDPTPPPSDDSDSDWEPAVRKPAKKRQPAGRAAKAGGRAVGECAFILYQITIKLSCHLKEE